MRKEKTAIRMRDLQDTADEKYLIKLIESYPNLKRYTMANIREIHKQFSDYSISKKNSKGEKIKGIEVDKFLDLIFLNLPHIKALSERNAGVVVLFFQSESTSDGILLEANFFKLLSILAKGSLYEQFNLCLQIICPKDDMIKKDLIRSSLDILYRINFTGTTSYDVCSQRLDAFVDKLFSNDDYLPRDKLKDFLTTTHPLDELWTQLFLHNE